MSRFLRNCFTYVMLSMAYFSLVFVINQFIYKNQIPRLEQKRVLIAGDSHPQTSIDPAVVGEAQNIAQTVEPYVITFWKLQHLLSEWQPDTILLGFAHHNISEFNDLKFWKEPTAEKVFERYYSIQKFRDLPEHIKIDYTEFYKVLFKEAALIPKANHAHYIGNYTGIKQKNIADWKSAIQRHYYFEQKELGISEISIHYLDSIVNLCERKNIDLILVANPVQVSYRTHIPESIVTRFNDIKSNYAKNHLVVDMSGEIYHDSLFLDADHLNDYGAQIFTRALKSEIDQAR